MHSSQFSSFLLALSLLTPFASAHAVDDHTLNWKEADALLRQEQETLTAQLLELKTSLLKIEPLVQKAYRASISNYTNEEFIQRELLFEENQKLLLSVRHGIGKLAGIFVRRLEFGSMSALQESLSADLMIKFESQVRGGQNSAMATWIRSVLEKVRDRAHFFFEQQKREEEYRLEAIKRDEARKFRFSALEGLQKQVNELTRWSRKEFEALFWVAQEWPGYPDLKRQMDRRDAEAQLLEKLKLSRNRHAPQERLAATELLASYDRTIQSSFKGLAAWAGDQILEYRNRVPEWSYAQLPSRSEREQKALNEKEWEGFCEGVGATFTPNLADRLRISTDYLAKLAQAETSTATCAQLLE